MPLNNTPHYEVFYFFSDIIFISMEKVIFDEVEYLKASVVAKKFKYTSDYIGQLCRGKKVDARLVGRTWFVNPDSVVAHKKTKYKTFTDTSSSGINTSFKTKLENENIVDSSVQTTTSVVSAKPRQVQPVLTTKASKQLVELPVAKEIKVSYEADTEDLLPKIKRREFTPSKKIFIRPADAKNLRIKKTLVGQAAFVPDELPEVSLSGNLSISTYETENRLRDEDDSAVATDNKPKNKAISDVTGDKTEKLSSPVQPTKRQEQMAAHVTSNPVSMKRQKGSEISLKVSVNQLRSKAVNDDSKAVASTLPTKPIKQQNKPNFQKISASASAYKPPQVSGVLSSNQKLVSSTKPVEEISTVVMANQKPAVISRKPDLLLPVASIVLAILCVGLILSASSSLVTSGTKSDSHILFQMANLRDIFSN